MANSTVWQSEWKPIAEPRGPSQGQIVMPKHWLKFYEEAVIESEARTAVKSDSLTVQFQKELGV